MNTRYLKTNSTYAFIGKYKSEPQGGIHLSLEGNCQKVKDSVSENVKEMTN